MVTCRNLESLQIVTRHYVDRFMFLITENEMTENKLFPGFKAKYKKDFFKYPLTLEKYWCLLSGSEQKVLDFILRQTFGFQKTSDKISLSQYVTGIGKNNHGAGISRSQAQRAVRSLEKKGFITIKENKFRPNTIHLRLEEEVEFEEEEVECSYDVEELIRMFEPIATYHIEEYLKDKRQIQAIETMLTYHGNEVLAKIISQVIEYYGYEYMPVITSPLELKNKMAKFLASVSRQP